MTGHRGDRVLYDDPHSVEGALSDVQRSTVLRVFAETVTTRLNSPERSAIVVVMQGLHEQDLSGYILERELGYEHLCLPMEFEPERRCMTSIGFRDPRNEEGELLFPERFPADVVTRDKRAMGELGTAGQFQQRPTPRGGGMFPTDRFVLVDHPPEPSRSPTRSATGTRPEPRTVAPSPPGCCCIGSRTGGSASRTAGAASGGPSTASVRSGRWPSSTASASGSSWSRSRAPAARRARRAPSATSRAGASPPTGRPARRSVRAEPYAAQVQGGNVLLVKAGWTQRTSSTSTSPSRSGAPRTRSTLPPPRSSPPPPVLRPRGHGLRPGPLPSVDRKENQRLGSGGAAGRVGPAGGVPDPAPADGGADDQGRTTRVRAGAAAAGDLRPRRPACCGEGRAAPGRRRLRRRQAPGALPGRAAPAEARSGRLPLSAAGHRRPKSAANYICLARGMRRDRRPRDPARPSTTSRPSTCQPPAT